MMENEIKEIKDKIEDLKSNEKINNFLKKYNEVIDNEYSQFQYPHGVKIKNKTMRYIFEMKLDKLKELDNTHIVADYLHLDEFMDKIPAHSFLMKHDIKLYKGNEKFRDAIKEKSDRLYDIREKLDLMKSMMYNYMEKNIDADELEIIFSYANMGIL